MLKGVYKELGLPFTEEFEHSIKAFMDKNRSFKKNSFSLSGEEKRAISREMEFQMSSCNYIQDDCC